MASKQKWCCKDKKNKKWIIPFSGSSIGGISRTLWDIIKEEKKRKLSSKKPSKDGGREFNLKKGQRNERKNGINISQSDKKH